ncbi:unnamed protein product, partial [Rotaria sp. Silwood1]
RVADTHGKHVAEDGTTILSNIDSDQLSQLVAALQQCFDTKDDARIKALSLKSMEIVKSLKDKPVGKQRRDTLDELLDYNYYKTLATRDRDADINQLNTLIGEYMRVLSENEAVLAEQLSTAFTTAVKENHKEYVRQLTIYARKCAKGEPLNRRNKLLDFLEDDDED